jgi:hypothetical protein
MAPRFGGPPSRAGWAYQRTEAGLVKVLRGPWQSPQFARLHEVERVGAQTASAGPKPRAINSRAFSVPIESERRLYLLF